MEHNENGVEAESKPKGLTEKQLDKQTRIEDACRWKDLETLRALGCSEGGFLTDELRRQACSCFCWG
jgi:hypothetical protein